MSGAASSLGAYSLLGSGISSIGTGLGDFATAGGYKAAAAAYGQAADIAGQNENLAKSALLVELSQQQRKFEMAMGSQQAELGAAGVGTGGTSQALRQSSTQQGAMASEIININGTIQQNAYQSQKVTDLGMQKQAEAAAKAAQSGGIFGMGGGLLEAGAAILMLA